MSDLHDQGFVEVGDRCFVARYASFDVNVGVVVGSRGLLVIDTRASETEAQVLLDHIRQLSRGPVVAVLNTHWHFDHTFGNAAVVDAYDGVDLHCHEAAAATLRDEAEDWKPHNLDLADPREAAISASRIVVPDHQFSSIGLVDLGDRAVEMVHPGRGHTSGDVVARVPDADVVYAGDLIEQSSDGVPGFGTDCYPLEWGNSLDIVVGMLTDDATAVPGHGTPVTREFVQGQRQDVSDVSQLIRSLYTQGVGVDDALDAGGDGWAFPAKYLPVAVRRGYQHLAEAGFVAGSAAATQSTGLPTLPLA